MNKYDNVLLIVFVLPLHGRIKGHYKNVTMEKFWSYICAILVTKKYQILAIRQNQMDV